MNSSLSASRASGLSRGAQSFKMMFNTSMAEMNPNTTLESIKTEVRVFMQRRTITRLAWMACIFLAIGNLVTLITALAPGWAWSREINGEFTTAGEYYGLYGIWYICWDTVDGQGHRECNLVRRLLLYDPTAFFKSVQALSCLTIIFGFISFITLGAYMCVPTLNYSYKVIAGYIGAAAMAAFCNLSLFVTYGTSFLIRAYRCCNPAEVQREVIDYRLSYCFYMSVVGTVAFTCSAITAGCEITKMKKERRLARRIRRSGLKHYEPQPMIVDPQTLLAYNNPSMINNNQFVF